MTLEGSRLYLNRFWFYEDSVAVRLGRLVAAGPEREPRDLLQAYDKLFAASETIDADQKQAILTAAGYRFSVVSGGPGSGKTSTVVRIIALLLALDTGTKIALAAPTGKAAARMMDSIRQHIDRLGVWTVRSKPSVPV